MGHEGTKIIGIVNILADLQPVLRTSYKDLGQIIAGTNASGQYLVNINPMSKYKPFAYPATSFASDAARLAALRSRNCGLKFEKYRTPTACLERAIALGDGGVAVTYNRPTGGINTAPFRLLDFKEYDGSMGAPFRYGITPQECIRLQTPYLDLLTSAVTNIALEDLVGNGTADYPNLSGYKIGVAWRPVNSTAIAFSQTTDSSATAWRSSPYIVDGTTYNVCCFLSPITLKAGDSQTEADYYLAPMPLSSFKMLVGAGLDIRASKGTTLSRFRDIDIKFRRTSGSLTVTNAQVVATENGSTQTKDISYTYPLTITTSYTASKHVVLDSMITDAATFKLRLFSGSSYVDQTFVPSSEPIE